MSNKVIILGGQGNAAVIGKAIVDANQRGYKDLEFAGFLNDRIEAGTLLEGFPVMGSLEQAPEFVDKGYYFINAIYRIDGNKKRIKLFEKLAIPESRLANFVHPLAYVAPDVHFGSGCAVMPQVSISPEVRFGKCCVIFQGATVGHNTEIGDYCHISAQGCVGSYVSIGNGVHIGMNATVLEHLTVGSNSTLGMGSALSRNIGEDEVWFGMPANFLRKVGNK